MSKLPTADEARMATKHKISQKSSKLIDLVVKSLNEAFDKGHYQALVSVPEELNPFIESVINTLESVGYSAKERLASRDQRNGYNAGIIEVSWRL